uniref:Uncharacterized protein n=1 Tax=Arundo donax TaxID=35708 RepID=A0A0A8YZE4_ARUDO
MVRNYFLFRLKNPYQLRSSLTSI